MSTVPTQVKCVSGCGAGVDWLSIIIALIGLVLAAGALFVAWRAWKVSKSQLEMQREEHKAFIDQMTARSDLAVEIHMVDHDADEQEIDGPSAGRVLAIGIKNKGVKPAERVAINVLAPRTVQMRWSGPNGEILRDSGLMATTSDTLTFEGELVEVHYLNKTIGPIDPSIGGTMQHVFLTILVGEVQALASANAKPNRVGVPIVVKLTSEDQPEGNKTVMVERAWAFTGKVHIVGP